MDDENHLPAWVDVLDRKPIQVSDDTRAEDIQEEFAERLLALLDSHNGLEPTADGWRRLALELALKHEPAFKIETPADREGRSGIGGRPAGWSNFIQRSAVKQELRNNPGISMRAAAKKAARRTGIDEGTLRNALSRKPSPPDDWRIMRYRIVAERAALLAAQEVSQE